MNGLPTVDRTGVHLYGYLGYGKFESNCLMKCRNMFKYKIRLLTYEAVRRSKGSKVMLKKGGGLGGWFRAK